MEKVAAPAAAEGLPTEPALRKIRIPFLQRGTVAIGGVRELLFVIDLGLRGVFIERPQPLDVGQEIEVWFVLPGNEIAVHARCRVAWWRPAEAAASERRRSAAPALSAPTIVGVVLISVIRPAAATAPAPM